MSKDLTVSEVERQNILNNPYVIDEIEKATKLEGIKFNGKIIFLKEQLANFFEITPRTIDNYLAQHENELKNNGYEVLRGKPLQELKDFVSNQYVNEINFVNISTPQLGIFDFRSFLNLAMLLKDSNQAQLLRQTILDIVLDTINKKTGGGTKYINQRDEDFIISYFKEENYRKEFTDALNNCLEMGKHKYPLFTDKVYKSIFKENAQEYRKILKLHEKENVRDTFYAEIIDLVSSYEFGFGDILKKSAENKGRKLSYYEANKLFEEFESLAHWKPLVEKARNKMASRDMAFRDALHHNLKEYITPLGVEEFERFLGEKSKELLERMEETKDVFKRLKERE